VLQRCAGRLESLDHVDQQGEVRANLLREAALRRVAREEEVRRPAGRLEATAGLGRVEQVDRDRLIEPGDGPAGPRRPDHPPSADFGELRRNCPADDSCRAHHHRGFCHRIAQHDSLPSGRGDAARSRESTHTPGAAAHDPSTHFDVIT